MNRNLFLVGIIVAASGLISPPVALLAGLAYGLLLVHPFSNESKLLTKFLLQASVVALGFGMNLHRVVKAGREGFLYTAVSISAVMIIGLTLGYFIRVGKISSYLISVGTAICGGSAIAAVGPITRASDEEMAVGLGTVFVLNSIALLIFPIIGHAIHLTQAQFGLWSALAIHDTSSVVGATAKYGATALAVGTTIKLTRALWIIPVSVITAATMKSRTRIQWPWFVGFFFLAAVLNTMAPSLGRVFHTLNHLGIVGLTVTLFLIGTGLSRETVRQVGVRPLLQGIVLWIIVATCTLALIFTDHLRL